jgi:two-component system sensor histidine kinase MtrB
VTAVSRLRQRYWTTAFRRSSFGRAVIRRLPVRVKQGLRTGNRWRRRAGAQLRTRWRRSLQLRVVSTTLVLCVLVIAVLGYFLVQTIATGLLASAEKSATAQAAAGRSTILGLSSVLVLQQPEENSPTANAANVATVAARTALDQGGNAGNYLVAVHLTDPLADPQAASVPWVAQVSSTSATYSISPSATIPSGPTGLLAGVSQEQSDEKFDNQYVPVPQYQPTTLVGNDGQSLGPALAVGVPLGPYYQLYYVYPFTSEQSFLLLVQRVLVGAGLALAVLLAAIASLVTRWVVLPVRHAAQAAQRLSAGHLEERMRVLGVDDLAALATSFNEMASSLQGKLRELEELSKVQRQFVSDVSHELRTPLTTIKMAADLLFQSRGELEPGPARSAELLQSQLERFETLLVDLLEISRYDAGAATLDADLVDVCDLVRNSAGDAQQLAERRGGRIEFRLPATGCFAEVDRRRVERILRNILVNAVEHGEGKDVVVTTAMDNDAVAVSVRDYGVGLRPGDEQQVFERFWRADVSRARTTGGTGLGLAISLEDAHLHGGWLQAWGERGQGSVFRLTLPKLAGHELAGSPLPLDPDDAELTAGPNGHRPLPHDQDHRDDLA